MSRPKSAGLRDRRKGTSAVLSGTSVDASRRVYRPRHPERTAFYQLLEKHLEEYLHLYEERFEPQDGPFRPVVKKVVQAYLDCGRLYGGFARLKCDSCGAEHLLAFSCATRNFCSSCQAKRAALFAQKLTSEILADVPHRHFVFTIPKALRGLFRRERRLLSLLSQTAYDAIRKTYQAFFDRNDVVPGCIASIQTFGSFANFHPHLHLLVSEGVFTREREFLPLDFIDVKAIETLFQRLLLRRLHHAERLSEGFIQRLETWRHPGFSTYAEQVVLPHETERLERLARYITRAPLNPSAVSIDEHGSVRVSTPPDPKTGIRDLVLDPLEWIHLITSQIPDPRIHLTRAYGAYANKVRKTRIPPKPDLPHPASSLLPDDEDPPFLKARKASWAALLRHIFESDPMICPKCSGSMRVIAVITDPAVVDRILAHIREKGIVSPFEPRPPPSELNRASTNAPRDSP